MKLKSRSWEQGEQLKALRQREEQLTAQPSAEGYAKLAAEYQNLGLNKESDRLLQLAETLENHDSKSNPSPESHLMFGAVDPVMLIEVIQILSRTTLTGELVIDAPKQSFHLFFNAGQIINASSDSHEPGIKSFRMALRANFGTYRFIKKGVETIDQVITEKTDILLLDAMHDADKEQAAL